MYFFHIRFKLIDHLSHIHTRAWPTTTPPTALRITFFLVYFYYLKKYNKSHPMITFWRYLRGIAWAGTPVLRCSVVRLGKAGYLRMGLSSAMLSKQTWVPVFSGLFWRPCDSLRETPGSKFMVSSLKLPENLIIPLSSTGVEWCLGSSQESVLGWAFGLCWSLALLSV